MPTNEQVLAVIDYVKRGAGEWMPLATIDFDAVKDTKFLTRTRRADGTYYVAYRSREETQNWFASKNTWLYDAEYLSFATEATKEQILNILSSLVVTPHVPTPLIDFILDYKPGEDDYNVGQVLAQTKYPIVQPVPFPESENKKDRQKNLINGYCGAGYSIAINEIAPEIVAALAHTRIQMQAEQSAEIKEKDELLKDMVLVLNNYPAYSRMQAAGEVSKLITRYNQLQQS